jgi:uncharacterized protein
MGMIFMRKFAFGVGLAFAVALSPAWAQSQPEDLQNSIEKKLQGFDPAAVAAARHYYHSPILQSAFKQMVPQIMRAMDAAIQQSNPTIEGAAKRDALDVAQSAVSAKIELITDLSMVNALEVFSKDELIALDQFYSSPTGQSVMTKMPQVMAKLPSMMQVVMPLLLDDVRAKLKAKGLELKQ